jgi:hypothetical protein
MTLYTPPPPPGYLPLLPPSRMTISEHWYAKASDKAPTTGRLYYHLANLGKPYYLQQLRPRRNPYGLHLIYLHQRCHHPQLAPLLRLSSPRTSRLPARYYTGQDVTSQYTSIPRASQILFTRPNVSRSTIAKPRWH